MPIIIRNQHETRHATPGRSAYLPRIQVGSQLPNRDIWKHVIDEWRKLMDRYVAQHNIDRRSTHVDLPYWYDEQTNVGFFAGAVWCLGGLALLEGSYRPSGRKDRRPKRCDMSFQIGQLNCDMEAKQIWTSSRSNKKTIQRNVRTNLAEAEEQLRRIKLLDRAVHGLVLCFIVPEFKCPSRGETLTRMQEQFIRLTQGFQGSADIFADYSPEQRAQIRDVETGKWYPGIALVGQLVQNYNGKGKNA